MVISNIFNLKFIIFISSTGLRSAEFISLLKKKQFLTNKRYFHITVHYITQHGVLTINSYCLLCLVGKHRQVKINDNNEQRFGVVMTPFSSSKMKRINCQKKFA